MEIFKSAVATVCFLCIAVFVTAQEPESIQKAFKESYLNEYNANYTAAIADLQKVYRAENYEINLRLGWLYYLAKQYVTSINHYQKAIEVRKYSIEARLGFIKPANESKQYEKAYQKYEEILTIDPYNSVANYWVGANYYATKKYDVAVKYLELVVNMYPFDYDANVLLGWSYVNLGRIPDAKNLFLKALYNKPGDKSALEGLEKCK